MESFSVLVAEDDVLFIAMLERFLKNLGFKSIFIAHDGKSAIEHLQSQQDIQLIIIDWNMPGMSGLDLLKAIQNNYFEHDFKTLFLTGETDPGKIIEALEHGANEYLMKPITLDMLKEKLDILGVPFSLTA